MASSLTVTVDHVTVEPAEAEEVGEGLPKLS